MSYTIGIDLGTSSIKALALSSSGGIVTAKRTYPLYQPTPNASEQHPGDWYDQAVACLDELLTKINPKDVTSMAISGQMHGLVMLDDKGKVIRPAMLWNDGRAEEETDYLNKKVGEDFLIEHTGNIAFAGFTAPKLLWVKNHEPDHFNILKTILLPKDYLIYRLSGCFATDVSDASGTLYFDVNKRTWSSPMLHVLDIDETMLPRVYESAETVGKIKASLLKRWNLNESVSLKAGGGDNAMAAVGMGVENHGQANVSIGTSGTIYVESDTYAPDQNHAIHMFCSANRSYHYLACMLSAAGALKWWMEDILKTDQYNLLDADFSEVRDNPVFFLPFLTGERAPHNDSSIRAMFYGMNTVTNKKQMGLSVMEGVAFVLRQNLDAIRKLGVKVEDSYVCGGGAKSKIWLTILANALQVRLHLPSEEEGASLGAALIAAKGDVSKKEFASLRDKATSSETVVEPNQQWMDHYQTKYETFKQFYPAIKSIFINEER